MAGRDIKIPFGPDKTGGLGFEPLASEEDAVAEAPAAREWEAPVESEREVPAASDWEAPAEEHAYAGRIAPEFAAAAAAVPALMPASEEEPELAAPAPEQERRPRRRSDRSEAEPGPDAFQMSVLALKDSIGQGRELKEREKEREALGEALKADRVELADRENILMNYQALAAEQDALIAQGTQQREMAKAELAQVAVSLERAQAELDAMREQHAVALQPIEGDLGRARAAADQAKNDERSRKSELNAAEAELRRADEAAANTMAVAQHQQSQAAYDEARVRSEQAKEYLAQVQKAYDDARARADQATGPLERSVGDLNQRAGELKDAINRLGEEVSAARNRRQYCDTVYQYPDETAKMRAEVEEAEALARRMDADNRVLRKQLAESKQKAIKAKVAIGVVALIIIVFIVCFVVLSGR